MDSARFNHKPSSFHQASPRFERRGQWYIDAMARSSTKAHDLIARLEAKGFSKQQAEFSVFPIEARGFTSVAQVRRYLEKTRPALFEDNAQGSLFEEGTF